MSEKYYVVSESELLRLVELHAQLSDSPGYAALQIRLQYHTAEAACRARPVPEGATHFYARHIEPSSGDYETPIGWFKEIKR